MSANDLVMYRGDDRTFTMTVTVDGVAYDLTSVNAVKFTAKRRMTDPDGDAIMLLSIGSGITVTTPASGILQVAIPRSATSGFTQDTMLYWDLQITDSTNKTRTAPEPAPGTLYVRSDVTRA